MPPRSPLRSRRRRDTAIAALITAVVVIAGLVIYVKSDARATTLSPAVADGSPAPMMAAPSSLQQVWSLPTAAPFGAVASPYGTVVTADDHTVTGHDAVTGLTRWSYGRSNVALCALGSGDTRADTITSSGAVRGILTGYVKGDRCSEITLLNPMTGERLDQRTGFTGADSTLVFGGPYGGLVSSDLVELWRYDLVRTIQYGNQPEPTKPNTKHLGCEFDDIALTGTQFGTIEHCDDTGASAQLVINYADPGSVKDAKSKGWDWGNYDPRATVDLASDRARLLSVTSEQAAVLVESPTPAVVVYDAAGTEVSRTTIDITTADFDAADALRVTPVRIGLDARYVLVGSSLIAVRNDGLEALWTMHDVVGQPAVVADELLVPTAAGIAVVSDSTGEVSADIPVDRAGYTGRVDLATVGNTVVETRGDTVVGLRDPAAPATDAPVTSSTATSTGSRFSIPSRPTLTSGGTSTSEASEPTTVPSLPSG